MPAILGVVGTAPLVDATALTQVDAFAIRQFVKPTRSPAKSHEVLPRSVQQIVINRVEASFEFLGDDGGSVMKSDRRFARDCRTFAQSTIATLADEVLRPWRAELAAAVAPLAKWLGTHSIDDPEEAVDLIAHAAGLSFVETRVVIAPEVRDRLLEQLVEASRTAQQQPAKQIAASVLDVARDSLAEHVDTNDGGWKWLRGYLESQLRENECIALNAHSDRDLAMALVALVEQAQGLTWSSQDSAAAPYDPNATYVVGQRVIHPRFGEGVVTRLLDAKIDVTFGSGRRVLAAGRRSG